jgi:predicted nucleic acid-binding Zn ribbon protein
MERAGRLISKLKLPAGSVCVEELACAGWRAAVGKRVAAHTRAVGFVAGRLCVEVEDAVWQRQLTTLKSQILKKLEEVLGQSVVGQIEFRVSPRRRLPQWAESPRRSRDDAEQIQDPLLRTIYKQQRRGRSA